MPYYLTDGKIIELEGSGPFLGPVKKMKFAEYEIDVGNSGSLLVYTDGVLDITDSDSVPIGKKLLLGLLKTDYMTPFEKFTTMKKNILNEDVLIKDDCTMLLMNFK